MFVQKLACSEVSKCGLQAMAQLSYQNVQFQPRITHAQKYVSVVCISFTVAT